MDDLNKHKSKKIKELHKQRNLSTCFLAKKADLNPSTFRNRIMGKSIPRVEFLTKLCNAFKIPLPEFFIENQIDLELTPQQEKILYKWMLLSSSEQQTILEILESDLS